jgi:CRP/FNR family transcriptional regulator
MPDTLLRRFIQINLAKRVDAPHCEDCNARHAGLCDALSDDDLSLLANAAHSVSVAAETGFMEEGAPATYFYNVNEGFVRLFKSLADGRRQIIGFAGAGAFLGLADTKTYVVSAEAMQGAKLCRFDRKSMREAFVTFPALERRLLEIAMHELALSSERFLLLGRKTARERLASFLLAWAVQMEFCPEDGIPPAGTMLHLPMSRTDIADYLGLTIETVSRSFSQLRKDGILLLPEIHNVVLLKPQALTRIAEAA